MAVVDFSNATFELRDDFFNYLPVLYGQGFSYYNPTLTNSEYLSITSNLTFTELIRTANYRELIFTGTFSQSGNEIYLYCFNMGIPMPYKISNITFNEGDIFSFVIPINFTYN